VRAIVGGERDPWKLAELSHPRIQASRAEIAKSPEGHWRQELIFVLSRNLLISPFKSRNRRRQVPGTSDASKTQSGLIGS